MSLGKERHLRNRAVHRVRDMLYGKGCTPTPAETRLAYIMAIEPRPDGAHENYFGPWPTNRGIDLIMREDLLFRTRVCARVAQLFDELDDESQGNRPDVVILVGPEKSVISELRSRISAEHPELPVAAFTFVENGAGTRYPESPRSIAVRAFDDLCEALVKCGVLPAK